LLLLFVHFRFSLLLLVQFMYHVLEVLLLEVNSTIMEFASLLAAAEHLGVGQLVMELFLVIHLFF